MEDDRHTRLMASNRHSIAPQVVVLAVVALVAVACRPIAGLGDPTGGPYPDACNEAAEISVAVGIDHDVPCAGEPPAGCATLPPTPDPQAVAASKPFRQASLDVALDHEGRYEVRLGTATLPHGYLSELGLDIADHTPDTFWIDGGIRLDVRPDIAGRPTIGSIYRDPFVGEEPVTIFLVFEVTQLDSPSVLHVRDVVVR
jgi:hypothetical protein